MPTLTPQTARQKLLIVSLLLFLVHPLALLAISRSFEEDAADIESKTEEIGEQDGGREGGKGRAGDSVEEDDGQRAKRHPGCLREEGDGEFGRRSANAVEARVPAVFSRDAGEQE